MSMSTELIIGIVGAICFILFCLGVTYYELKNAPIIDDKEPFLLGDMKKEDLEMTLKPVNGNAKVSEKTLVVVDFQYDFYDKENGALYVPGAETALKNILKAIDENNYDKVVLTLDWHNPTDASFKVNGGIWPNHCVQYSLGAGIHPDIIKHLNEKKITYQIFLKGDSPNHEEYGAFERNYPGEYGDTIMCSYSGNSEVSMYSNNEQPIEICGLAGDYCVFSTYKMLVNAGFDVKPLYDCIGWIGQPYDYSSKM